MTEETDDNKEVEVKTGFGSLRARGYHLGNVLQIVAAVLLALMAMMMYEMRAETKATAALLTTATKDAVTANAASSKLEHEKLSGVIEKMADQQEVTNYLFTLAPADREKLNLRMPDSLRHRIMDR